VHGSDEALHGWDADLDVDALLRGDDEADTPAGGVQAMACAA
jgi:hypothetical protein